MLTFAKPLGSLVRKFFPLDKNYLLEQAQIALHDSLLLQLVDAARKTYVQAQNPLGLNDAFSEKILFYEVHNLKPLSAFYFNLAGIYRYKFGDNQLGFLWSGADHSEHYGQEWSATFSDWCARLCQQTQFVQAVLDLTVFLPQNRQAHLAENRMNAIMLNLFEVKLHKQKGIVAMKVA